LICTASADSQTKVWDIAKQTVVQELHYHKGCVKTIQFDPENPCIIVTGSRDNSIAIFDTRFENKRTKTGTKISIPVKQIINAHGIKKSTKYKSTSSVTGAVFRNSNIISSGSSDGYIGFNKDFEIMGS
jgi:WD40 repeat protein